MSFQDIVKQFVSDVAYEAAQQKNKKKAKNTGNFLSEVNHTLDEMEDYLQEKTKFFGTSSRR